MSAFTRHFSFEFRSGIRNRTLLMLFYLFPLGFYVMTSAMMSNINPVFRDTLIPAMVFFAVLTGSLLGIPDPIVKAREAGIFRSYKIHGIPELSILIIPALTTLMHMVLVALIITLSAPLLFDAALPINWPGFLLAFTLMVLASTGIGLLFGVIAPNSQSAILMGQAIFLPSMLIGGLMFPTGLLPEILGKLSRLLPTTHAMNLYNVYARGLLPEINPILSVLVLALGAILTLILAIYLFNWDSHNETRKKHPALVSIAIVPFAAAVLLAFVPASVQGAGVFNGDLYIYTQSETHNLTQDGTDGFIQFALYGDVLAYTRVDADTMTNLWVSRQGATPYVLVANIDAVYPISFTQDGLILFAQNTTAVSESQRTTDVYIITTEADSQPEFVGQLDSSMVASVGCEGGSPMATGGQHRILEMTPYGIVYSLDCAGMRTALLNLETNESVELGENFGNVVVSPDRTRLMGIVYDASTETRHTQLAIADLNTSEVRPIETASEPDQVTWSSDGEAVFYTVYEVLSATDQDQQTSSQSLDITDETNAGFPLYAVQIHRYDLTTQAGEVVYAAPNDVSTMGRIFAVDENTLVFSQLPSLQAWVAASADGQFDSSSAQGTRVSQLDDVPATVLQLTIDTGIVTEIGNNIKLFTPALQIGDNS